MSTVRAIFVSLAIAAAAVYAAGAVALIVSALGAHPADGEADLLVLGFPWSLLVDLAPGTLRPIVLVLAPLLDVAVLVAIIVLLVRGRRSAYGVQGPGAVRSVRLAYAASILVAVVAALLLAWWLVDPAPPDRIRVATGPEDGFYERLGRLYDMALDRYGVEAALVPTAGTPENLRLLEAGEVDVAFIQGGVAPPPSDETPLRALASLAIEPLWLFSREDMSLTDLLDTPDVVIAAGAEHSGTRALLRRVLSIVGIRDEVTLLPLSGDEAADALLAGKVDVAAFVTAPTTGVVQRLLGERDVWLVRMENREALLRRLPFAHAVDLPRRSIDFRADIPRTDVGIIGASTSLVVREELHPAVKALLLQVTERIARGNRLLGTWGEFPSQDYTEFALDPEAERFFTYGPTLVRRYLPYWAANILERFWVLIIPIATLVLPIVRFGPSTVAWGIRRRIYLQYRRLKELELAAEAARTDAERSAALSALEKVEEQLKAINVPLAYRDDLYRLRMHAAFVRNQLTDTRPVGADGLPNGGPRGRA